MSLDRSKLDELWDIRTGDCREILDTLPERSVQCVVTSPPYWGLRSYEIGIWQGGNPACEHLRNSSGDGPKQTGQSASGYAANADRLGSCSKCGAVVGAGSMIGLEGDVQQWVDVIVDVFRKVHRVLRDDGTLWLNLGDKYNSSPKGNLNGQDKSGLTSTKTQEQTNSSTGRLESTLPAKNLLGLPWRVAFALQADGWYLRRDIIWHKPNPMPESVTDRPSTAHEYVFLLTKQPRYFYDAAAVQESVTGNAHARATGVNPKARKSPDGWDTSSGEGGHGSIHRNGREKGRIKQGPSFSAAVNELVSSANLRSVWKISTQAFSGPHYATYPEKLVEPCIKAGTSERGECPECGVPRKRMTEPTGHINSREVPHVPGNTNTKNDSTGWGPTSRPTNSWIPSCVHETEPVPQTVLDPFSGAGTTGLVAARFGRRYIGIELNPEYAEISRRRIAAGVGTRSPDTAVAIGSPVQGLMALNTSDE